MGNANLRRFHSSTDRTTASAPLTNHQYQYSAHRGGFLMPKNTSGGREHNSAPTSIQEGVNSWPVSERSSQSFSHPPIRQKRLLRLGCSTSLYGAGQMIGGSAKQTSLNYSGSRSPRTIRENARKFRVYARKSQTRTGQCFTRTKDAIFTPSQPGRTTKKPNAEHNAETRHPMTVIPY